LRSFSGRYSQARTFAIHESRSAPIFLAATRPQVFHRLLALVPLLWSLLQYYSVF
jgi:hypothetical protein